MLTYARARGWLRPQRSAITPPENDPRTPPLAVIQMAVKASFVPDEGFLGVAAQLTPASYVLSRDCHLTGKQLALARQGGTRTKQFLRLRQNRLHLPARVALPVLPGKPSIEIRPE